MDEQQSDISIAAIREYCASKTRRGQIMIDALIDIVNGHRTFSEGRRSNLRAGARDLIAACQLLLAYGVGTPPKNLQVEGVKDTLAAIIARSRQIEAAEERAKATIPAEYEVHPPADPSPNGNGVNGTHE